jgi:glucan phosphoethanolaminetransferase (alkaline phosphatase superfamily)
MIKTITSKQIVRIALDLAMTILFLFASAYRITGDKSHEWIGVSVFALFIAHNIFNHQWYKNIFRGKYTVRRALMTAVNITLALTTATLIITGLLQSRAVLAFLHLPGGMALRLIHTTAAYWLLALIGLHIGLHWGMVARRISNNRFIKNSMRSAAFLFAVFGVWSSFDRDMFSKLFLGFSFDYWPEKRPALLFFAETLSVMAVYYALKRLEERQRRE